MRYTQTNRKLQNLFNAIKSNERSLKNRSNDQLILDFFKTSIKNDPILIDTGWLNKAPDTNTITTSVKGDLLPEQLSFDYSTELELPESIIPYLETKVLVKTPPDSKIGAYEEYTESNTIGDYIEIKGDSTLLFKGNVSSSKNVPTDTFGTVLNKNNTFTETQLNDMGVPLTHTKNAFQGTIEHNGIAGHPSPGTLIGQVIKLVHTVVSGDIVTIFTTDVDDIPTHNITALNSTSFTAVGDESVEDTSTIDPPVITTDVTRTLSFASATSYTVEMRLSNLSSAGFSDTDIISQDFSFLGYWLFYSTLLQKQIVVSEVPFASEDFELINLPDTNDGDTLPHTTITLDRNPDGFPTTINTIDSLFLGGVGLPIIRKDLTIFRTVEETSNNLSLYYLKLRGGVTILSPANTDSTVEDINTQDDDYTVSGTSYSRTTNEVGTKSNDYVTAKQDVEYRVIIYIKNPLFYQETRRYGLTEQFE